MLPRPSGTITSWWATENIMNEYHSSIPDISSFFLQLLLKNPTCCIFADDQGPIEQLLMSLCTKKNIPVILIEHGLGFFEKMRTELMIDVQTMMDKSTSHISEMLMTGSNMGIINAIKNLKKYQNAHPEIRGLMEKLLQLEENNIQELKQYLS